VSRPLPAVPASEEGPRGPLAWPWSADSPLDVARRTASAYRAALEALSPQRCAVLDTWHVAHGQGWVVPTPWPYADHELLTPQQLADACHIRLRTVYHWHRQGLPYTRTAQGIRIRVRDLFAWQQQRRQQRLHP
jgi:hypothetical protein